MDVCERMTLQLSAWLDGELTRQEERELTAHLEVCPQCRALARQLEACRDAMGRLGEAEPPQGFAQRVMDQIAAEQPQKIIPLRRRPQVRALASLAACAALCLGLTRLAWSGGFSGGASEAADAAAQSITAQEAAAEHMEFADMESAAEDRAKTATEPAEPEANELEYQSMLPEADSAPLLDLTALSVTRSDALSEAQASLISTGEQLRQLLSAFPEDNLSHLTQDYGDAFFSAGKQLVAVAQQGGSDWKLSSLRYENGVLTVTLHQSPEGPASAAWLLLLEPDETFPPDCVCTVVLERAD